MLLAMHYPILIFLVDYGFSTLLGPLSPLQIKQTRGTGMQLITTDGTIFSPGQG